MKKVIKITEGQFKTIIENTIKEHVMLGANTQGFAEEENVKEDYPERELKRKETGFRRSEFDPYPKENDIMSIFKPYEDDIPLQVIQFMRKNPKLIAKRLKEIYGTKY